MPTRINSDAYLSNDAVISNTFATTTFLPSIFGQTAMTKKKIALVIILTLFCIAVSLFLALYTCHKGFRRTVDFWCRALPWIVEYNCLKFHSTFIAKHNETQWESIQEKFHLAAAPRVVEMVQEMGGIYVKIAQAMSTMGSGILPEEYVQALRPLQDGVPPRDYPTISRIIEQSTKRKMSDMFEEFEEIPIGAATIGQAHLAVLKLPRSGRHRRRERVVVKVQYPDVAELFDADLNNLEWLSWLIMPDRRHFLKNIRERHERELDFRLEADHLRECSMNMQKHGLEPKLVRIPRVMNETGLCTKDVLVMEYLEGVSLRDVMDEEQDRIARALGKKDGAELKYIIAKRMREHFEQGGGDDQQGGTQMKLIGGSNSKMAYLWNVLGPFAINGLRHYARIRDKVVRFTSKLAGNGTRQPPTTHHINLSRVLKTVMRAHAVQILLDGTYNLDPHPGNILVLPDGRVGLLDYGMVGRLTDTQRLNVAKTIYNLAHNKPHEVAKLYLDDGYHITYGKEKVTDPHVVFRISSTHFNKVDLTPIALSEDGGLDHDDKQIGMIELFEKMDVIFIPDWIVQARRVSRLLMGVSAQAARPVSLAKEWEPMARQALEESKHKEQQLRQKW